MRQPFFRTALILLLNVFCLSSPARSQSYAALWKAVTAAQEKDLPQSAVQDVDKIISLASRKGDGPQLLKAILVRRQLSADISLDSAALIIPLLERELAKEHRLEMKALYHAALGSLYSFQDSKLDEQSPLKAVGHFKASLEHPSLLAQKRTKEFLPLVIEGKDEHYFAKDLLNVVTRFSVKGIEEVNSSQIKESETINRLYHLTLEEYRRRNMREAEFFILLDSVDAAISRSTSLPRQKQIGFYRFLIDKFGDLDVCSKAYVRLFNIMESSKDRFELLQEGIARYPHSKCTSELRNLLKELTQPGFSVEISNRQGYPGREDSLYITAHNATKTVVRFYKTELTNEADIIRDNNIQLNKVPRHIAFEIPVTVAKGAPYEDVKCSIPFNVREPGIYFIILDGEHAKSEIEVYHVSRLHMMQLPLTKEQMRVVVSDALSGKPVSGAKVVFRDERQDGRITQTQITDGNGAVLMSADRNQYGQLFVSVENDAYCMPSHVEYINFRHLDKQAKATNTALYTDRSIYRPGQKVQIGGFVYQKSGDATQIVPQKQLELKLYDANYKQIASNLVTSDAMGAFASEFVLPSSCLNGVFSITTENGYASLRVEQYKRPTFIVEYDEVKTAYKAGDTVSLKGTVKTYAGFPLKGTRVALNVTRRCSPWCYWLSEDTRIMQTDTVQTDEQGHFVIPVALNIENDGEDLNKSILRFYIFNVKAVATSGDGESETAEYQLFAGNRPSLVSTSIPERLCRDNAKNYYVYQKNAGGQPIDGKAYYELYVGLQKKADGQWDFNHPIPFSFFKNLPSAEYTLKVTPSERSDTLVQLTCKFTLFSFNDKSPVGDEKLQLSQSATSFENGEIKLLFATPCENVYVHYDLFDANNRLLESNLMKMSNNSRLFRYNYNEEYGNGLSVSFAFVKDGKTYVQSRSMTKPVPDKKLSLQWKTFRNRLHPGQRETWTLQVTRKGKPVKASLLAALYDASLDKFQKYSLPFSLHFDRYIPVKRWLYVPSEELFIGWSEKLKYLTTTDFEFSNLNEGLFETDMPLRLRKIRFGKAWMSKSAVKYTAPVLYAQNMAGDEKTETAEKSESFIPDRTQNVSGKLKIVDNSNDIEKTVGNVAPLVSVAARTDFSETAFFQPSLTTADDGFVNISFTLPQSLTEWNFKALAHTQDVDYGVIDTMVTARKDFMLQPNMPRFLRNGDHAMLAATLRNATDKKISGHAVMIIEDPENGALLNRQKVKFSVEAEGETVVRFPITADATHPVVIVRMIAESGCFSDGEQHYLPILDDVQQVSESVPLSFTGKGVKVADLTALFGRDITKVKQPRLTVEYTGNPAWLAIEALPTLSVPLSDNAVSMATAYYSLCLAALEAKSDPEVEMLARTWRDTHNVDSVYLLLERNADLKQIVLNETPWVASANRERERLSALGQLFEPLTLSYRCESFLDKLLSLQTAEGGWSWFRGMPANLWITIDVVKTLARLKRLVTSENVLNQSKLIGSMDKAMKYIDTEVKKTVLRMREQKRKTGKEPEVSSTLLRYLYICPLNGYKPTDDRSYLVALLENSDIHYNMYEKSMAVNVLHAARKDKAARLILQSLMEHTVSRSDVGRYFDTDRAPWNWNSYRIPTQVAALEAVSALSPEDTLAVQEMTRWLVQAKRTQTWDDPISSVDAVYWLFLNRKMLAQAGGKAFPKIYLTYSDGNSIDLSPKVGDIQMPLSLGYYRKSLEHSQLRAQPLQLTFEKQTEPISFGSVCAQYLIPASSVKAAASGLNIACTYSVNNGGSWQQISKGTDLHIGDVIRIRYELIADRDYDFVCLKEGRPACCEPVEAMSGYDWQSSCYRAVGEALTQYFFQRLHKGKHVIESEMRVDRAGIYSSAVPTVQCVYSPEFCGRARNVTLNVLR